jgi:ABC-2 type transport system permease protein
MINILIHELRLFLRQRMALPSLLLMTLLSATAVWTGMTEIDRQHDVINRIQQEQAREVADVSTWVTQEGDAGNAAYYTFHATWDAPSPLAFAAIGQRDVAPYILRVRALALESQIYEGENYNAELALPGRFDWAFVLTYLAPLLLIVLLHDLQSGEREAGRIGFLRLMAGSEKMLWARRILLRVGLLFLALAIPFTIGAITAAANGLEILVILGLTFLYLSIWSAISLLVARLGMGSVANAATLAACWLILTLILPVAALLAINASFPVKQGIELTLAQREAVHGGWDRPKDATMQEFFRHHPEWRETKPVEGGFHWKWYYAFQHLGDLSVADQVAAYRQGLEARDQWTKKVGLILPTVGVQVAIHRLSRTDLASHLAYQDGIRTFHAELRRFYYPYLFNEIPFRDKDFERMPQWHQN